MQIGVTYCTDVTVIMASKFEKQILRKKKSSYKKIIFDTKNAEFRSFRFCVSGLYRRFRTL
jgi:hypothetical protein